MSESSQNDMPRKEWKEAIKRKIVSLFDAALVGGKNHVSYMQKLGKKGNEVFTGYDVIDNDYFRSNTDNIRERYKITRDRMGLPGKYFLASSRLISKKNLPFLIKAYADYRKLMQKNAFDLVIVGDGELRNEITALIYQLKLQHFIHLPGFRQYHQLPYYYAFASAFIHASISEQWGLVVNEAMASGLPVIVSEACGCAPDLVRNGSNGLTFSPYETRALTNIMLMMSSADCDLDSMGQKSREIISGCSPAQFGQGLRKAGEYATTVTPKKFSFMDRLLLQSMIAG
jgi:glycosyltransferase involved in cell wall biosynthesis